MVAKKNTSSEPETAETVENSAVAVRNSWAGITSAQDIQDRLMQAYGTVFRGTDLLGNEFELVDKKTLVDIPFTVLEYRFVTSDKFTRDGEPTEYSVVRGVRMDNLKMVAFADGGTGIHAQLKDFYARTKQLGGIFCSNGLVASEYDYVDPVTGDISEACTYYLGN
jgi:hypothetical protein